MKYLLLRLKSRSARGASRHPAFIGNCPTISHTCWPYLPRRWYLLYIFYPHVTQGNEDAGSVLDFILLFGVNQKNTRQRKSKIALCYPSSIKLLLRPSLRYNKLLSRVAFKILSNIHDRTLLRKEPTALQHVEISAEKFDLILNAYSWF